jgi:hypothetical protein
MNAVPLLLKILNAVAPTSTDNLLLLALATPRLHVARLAQEDLMLPTILMNYPPLQTQLALLESNL